MAYKEAAAAKAAAATKGVSAADVGQGVQQGGVVSQWEQGVKNVGQGLQAWGGAVGQGFGALFRTEAPPPRPPAETPPPRPPAEKAAPVEESILNRETLDLAPPKAKSKEEAAVEQMAPHVPSFPKKDIDQVFNATLWKRTKDESLGLGVGFQDGAVLVLAIKPGSPAAYSDPRLEINDRLLAVGGRPVAEDTDFAELLTTDKLRVVIKVVRNMTDIVGQLKNKFAREPKRIIDIFRAFDQDLSGQIEKQEFRLVLRKMVIVATSAEADAAFDSLDQDRSGSLNYQELCERFRGDTSNSRALLQPSRPHVLKVPDHAASSPDLGKGRTQRSWGALSAVAAPFKSRTPGERSII
jgi:hypothetical protein